jgi:competence protein ComEC
MSAMLVERPDILVERTAKNVAVRNDHGELVPAHPRRGTFAASQWLRMDGDGTTLRDASLRPGWKCEALICRATVKGRRVIYVSGEVPVMSLPCAEADILIAAFPLRGRCRSVPLRIDRFTVWRAGAHSIFIDADGVRIDTAQALQGERPWRVVPAPRRKDNSRPVVK